MDSKATVQALMDSIQKGDFEKAKSLLSNDFQFSGPVPEPINGEAWLGMGKSLKKAFPNLEYHFQLINMDGDIANISSELKGTHTGEFDLTGMNMGVIPATNKSFAAANEHGKVTVKGDKVTSWALESTKGAGLMAILGQLGVKTPTPSM
jgi:SnoaL-like polyketide cyclase